MAVERIVEDSDSVTAAALALSRFSFDLEGGISFSAFPNRANHDSAPDFAPAGKTQ
jgi:hypothetical protein